MGTHMPYGTTQCYLPPDRDDIPAFQSWYSIEPVQKGRTNLDFTEARDSDWQWHQLSCMQVCTSLQTDNHASTPPLRFLQAGCPSCDPTNSGKALKAYIKSRYTHTHTRLMALFRDYPGEPVPER